MTNAHPVLPTDILFLHADDRATIRHKYTWRHFHEGLLFHILYFGRAVVPVNFLLANQALDNLFTHHGDFSESSDIFQLIRSGHVLPLMFDEDFMVSTSTHRILDYAQFSLEKGIYLPCTTEQWLSRARFLNEFTCAEAHGMRASYRETLLAFLDREGIQGHYLPKLTPARIQFIESLRAKTSDLEHPTRSHTYLTALGAPSSPFRTGLELIADAAYYAAFADSTHSHPATTRMARAALLAHYYSNPSPFLFIPEHEDIEVIGAAIPDFTHLSIASILNDLKDTPTRRNWLAALHRHMARSQTVEPADEDLATPFGQFTHVLAEYFSSTGPRQKKDLLRRERRFFTQTRLMRLGGDIVLVLGAGIAATGLAQGLLRGEWNLTSLVSLATVGPRYALRRVAKHLEARRPIYGSTVPIIPTFTPRGTKRP